MDITIFKNKEFSKLMGSRMISTVGSKMQEFALSLYLLKVTGSTSLFALSLIISSLPGILIGPLAGGLIDLIDKKKLIVILDVVNSLVLIFYFIGFMFFENLVSITTLIFLIFFQSIISVIFRPAIKAMLPSVVGKQELVNANSIETVLMNGLKLAAPALAAILLSISSIEYILILNAISFILAACIESQIKINRNASKNSDSKKITLKQYSSSLISGFVLVKSNQTILTLILLICIVNFFMVPLFTVCMPHVLKKVLVVSDMKFGLYETVYLLPLFIAPFFVKKVIKDGNPMDILKKSYYTIAFLILAVGFTLYVFNTDSLSTMNTFIVLNILTFIIGFIVTISNIAHTSYLYTIIDESFMGRIGSIFFAMAATSIPLGQALIGFMLDIVHPSKIVLVMSLMMFAALIISFKLGLKKSNSIVKEDSKYLEEA